MNKNIHIILIVFASLMSVGYLIGYFYPDENTIKSGIKYYAYQLNENNSLIPALMASDKNCMLEIIQYHDNKTTNSNSIVVPGCPRQSINTQIPVYILDTISNNVIEIGFFEVDKSGYEHYYSGYVYSKLLNKEPYQLKDN